MESFVCAKRQARMYYKDVRCALGVQKRYESDSKIISNFVQSSIYRKAQSVCLYYSFAEEINTHTLASRVLVDQKQLILPRVNKGCHNLDFYRVQNLSTLCEGTFGILEPSCESSSLIDITQVATCDKSMVVVVPGLVFDKFGYRLGYGAGYYDRTLAKLSHVPCVTTVGLCRTQTLVDDLRAQHIVEAHDRPVDVVITEKCSYDTSITLVHGLRSL